MYYFAFCDEFDFVILQFKIDIKVKDLAYNVTSICSICTAVPSFRPHVKDRGWMNRQKDGWTDGRKVGWMDRWTDRWMDGKTNR